MRRRSVRALIVLGLVGLSSPGVIRGQQQALQSLSGFRTAPGLEVTLWASEPDFSNPTNLAIDERGRVWVLEAVNYRRALRKQPDIRPEGDRIVILEDTDGDGKADKTKVFDQSPQIRAPLGIAVLGNQVIVSQAPDLIVYTKDAEDRIVKKEVLLTGWLGVDHDHGLHAVTFGPDGRYYFNTGNTGFDVTDKSGRRVVGSNTDAGGKPTNAAGTYFGGSTMVVNPDGTDLRVLAHNFRNPYEVAVDSFGSLWQTDNDDDGNAATRANYVIEGGNYGFRGPYGRTWQQDRGTHWHAELPGVVPNMLPLGPGSPCGLVVYEGTLLGEKYKGMLLHAEAGRRLLAGYAPEVNGAGYTSRIEPIVYGGLDTWFRPSDVAVAPDGSVFIADWYDPSVGGHGMGDAGGTRGRIFRVAPPNHKPSVPALDLETPDGLFAAFRSPNQAVYYLAYSKLKSLGEQAVPTLTAMWSSYDNVLQARALWMLGGFGEPGGRIARFALTVEYPQFRLLALRVLRSTGADMLAISKPLLKDPSAMIRREILVMLQDPAGMTPPYLVGPQSTPAPALLDALVELAGQYDGKDRWYLEAIGIAARGREDALYERLRKAHPRWNATLGLLLWELRAPTSLPYLVETVNNKSLAISDRMQALEALTVMQQTTAPQAVEALILSDETPPELRAKALARYHQQLFALWAESRTSPNLAAIVRKGLSVPALQQTAVELATALNDPQYAPELIALSKSTTATAEVRAAALTLVGNTRDAQYRSDFVALLETGPTPVRTAAFRALDTSGAPDLETRAEVLVVSDAPNELRSAALRVLLRTSSGATKALDLQESGKLPQELRALATTIVNGRGFLGAGRGGGAGGRAGGPPPDPKAEAAAAAVRERALKIFPPLETMTGSIPTARQMEQSYLPDAVSGRVVFESDAAMCSACHSLGGSRKIGPDLSAIGAKLGKQAILDAILTPSAAIPPEFEYWTLQTTSRGAVSGVITEDTAGRVTLTSMSPSNELIEIRLTPSDITSRTRMPMSIMPDGLINKLTQQQVVDLLEFLTTLRGK